MEDPFSVGEVKFAGVVAWVAIRLHSLSTARSGR